MFFRTILSTLSILDIAEFKLLILWMDKLGSDI